MSSVPALAAAYYALEGHEYFAWSRLGRRETIFAEDELRERLSLDFQLRYVARWFLPWNVLRYWFTSFNRTDIMFDVLDANLYHGATFGDLKASGSQIAHQCDRPRGSRAIRLDGD